MDDSERIEELEDALTDALNLLYLQGYGHTEIYKNGKKVLGKPTYSELNKIESD